MSHSNFFKPDEKEKIKAKITAYLLPNKGTWVENSDGYEIEELDKLLFTKQEINDDDRETIRNNFFSEVTPSTDPKQYKLKQESELYTQFDALSQTIRDEANEDIKKALFKVRRNIETNFFMYLPVARWMRYKLYYGETKVFDHIYDAQSESMSIHECQILEATVERVLFLAIYNDNNDERKEVINNEFLRRIKDRATRKLIKDVEIAIKKFDKLTTSSSSSPSQDDLREVYKLSEQIKKVAEVLGKTLEINRLIKK